MRGLSPTTQLPLTILPLGAASPLLTDMGLSPALAADSLSWSALPELEPVSVTCRKPSSSALASTGWVKVTASARLSRNWRDWQFNAAKGSALPTVAVAASAGLASPDAGCGEGSCQPARTSRRAWTRRADPHRTACAPAPPTSPRRRRRPRLLRRRSPARTCCSFHSRQTSPFARLQRSFAAELPTCMTPRASHCAARVFIDRKRGAITGGGLVPCCLDGLHHALQRMLARRAY